MLCRMTAVLFLCLLAGPAWAQTAKPANPTKIDFDLMVVTVAVDARHDGFEEDLLRDIGSAVKSHESKHWSSLHDAVRRLLPMEKGTLVAAADAVELHTFPDLEQRVNFHTVFGGRHDHHRGVPTSNSAQTKVTAVPWILDEERFGLGVTITSEVPLVVSGGSPSREREHLEMTSNTLVNANEASIIMSRQHADTHGDTLLVVIARVSR